MRLNDLIVQGYFKRAIQNREDKECGADCELLAGCDWGVETFLSRVYLKFPTTYNKRDVKIVSCRISKLRIVFLYFHIHSLSNRPL